MYEEHLNIEKHGEREKWVYLYKKYCIEHAEERKCQPETKVANKTNLLLYGPRQGHPYKK